MSRPVPVFIPRQQLEKEISMQFIKVSNYKFINVDIIANFEIDGPYGDYHLIKIYTKRQERLEPFQITKKDLEALVGTV